MPRTTVVALLLLPSILAGQVTKPPTSGHESMPGMSMPVKIPKGAIFTEADVRFMQGMIAHHAQAIYMSRMAAGHGANPHLLKFATKIDQSQMGRDDGLSATRRTAISKPLDAAENQSGAARGQALSALTKQVDAHVARAKDAPRVRAMSAAVKALASASN